MNIFHTYFISLSAYVLVINFFLLLILFTFILICYRAIIPFIHSSFFFFFLVTFHTFLHPFPRHSYRVYSSPLTLRLLFPFPCRSPHLEGHHSPAEGRGRGGEERAVTLLIFKYTIVLYYGSEEVKTTFGMTPISPRSCRYFPRCLMV